MKKNACYIIWCIIAKTAAFQQTFCCNKFSGPSLDHLDYYNRYQLIAWLTDSMYSSKNREQEEQDSNYNAAKDDECISYHWIGQIIMSSRKYVSWNSKCWDVVYRRRRLNAKVQMHKFNNITSLVSSHTRGIILLQN